MIVIIILLMNNDNDNDNDDKYWNDINSNDNIMIIIMK